MPATIIGRAAQWDQLKSEAAFGAPTHYDDWSRARKAELSYGAKRRPVGTRGKRTREIQFALDDASTGPSVMMQQLGGRYGPHDKVARVKVAPAFAWWRRRQFNINLSQLRSLGPNARAAQTAADGQLAAHRKRRSPLMQRALLEHLGHRAKVAADRPGESRARATLKFTGKFCAGSLWSHCGRDPRIKLISDAHTLIRHDNVRARQPVPPESCQRARICSHSNLASGRAVTTRAMTSRRRPRRPIRRIGSSAPPFIVLASGSRAPISLIRLLNSPPQTAASLSLARARSRTGLLHQQRDLFAPTWNRTGEQSTGAIRRHFAGRPA